MQHRRCACFAMLLALVYGASTEAQAEEASPSETTNDEEQHEDDSQGDDEAHQASEHFQGRLRVGDPDRAQFIFGGEYGLRIIGQSDLRLSEVPTNRADPEENLLGPVDGDHDPNELGQNFYLLHWIRVRPELRFLTNFRLVGQIDLLHGHIAGDNTQYVEPARTERSYEHGLSGESVRPRHLYLEWMTPIGLLRAGQMGSHWGTGMLANDGDHADDYLFGDHEFGDIVERVVFFTKPFYRLTTNPIRELAMFIGGDIVFDDGIANLLDGDLAWQIIGGLLWRLDPERALGLYIAYRNQTYDDGDTLEITALDVYGEWSLRLAHQVSGYIEAEAVGIFGSTTAAPNLSYTEADIRQFGMTARVGLRLDRIGLDVRVEGGYTSGDANNNDDQINRFTMDPDYRVGLILFRELVNWSTARAAELSANEELVGVPQDGIDLIPTNGSVAGASFIYPSLNWRPLDWLDIHFALLIAQATSDVVSPFETKRQGRGASYRGGSADRRDLGFEIDLSIQARWDLSWIQLRGGVEGAYCVPGRAFDDAEGNRHDDIALIRGRIQLDW